MLSDNEGVEGTDKIKCGELNKEKRGVKTAEINDKLGHRRICRKHQAFGIV